MAERLDSIIELILKMHHRIIKKYKNLEIIEGQYHPRVQLIAKVLQEQTQRKINICQEILAKNMNYQPDFTEQGYQDVLALTKSCEQATIDSLLSKEDNILNAAESFTVNKIDLYKKLLVMLDDYKNEKGIDHNELKEKLEMILVLEEKDYTTLMSFKK